VAIVRGSSCPRIGAAVQGRLRALADETGTEGTSRKRGKAKAA